PAGGFASCRIQPSPPYGQRQQNRYASAELGLQKVGPKPQRLRNKPARCRQANLTGSRIVDSFPARIWETIAQVGTNVICDAKKLFLLIRQTQLVNKSHFLAIALRGR